MACSKLLTYDQSKWIPIYLADQILPGTFEYAFSHIIDNELALSIFFDRSKNAIMGAPAFDPAILVKIGLLAYSHGITSSRKIKGNIPWLLFCITHNMGKIQQDGMRTA